jgi:hypothetical protein
MSFYQPGEVIYSWVPHDDNPRKMKPRPVLVLTIESDTVYKVLKITKTNRTGELAGDWILKTSPRGKAMGLRADSFLNKSTIIDLRASLIVKRDSPWGEDPNIDDVLEELGL